MVFRPTSHPTPGFRGPVAANPSSRRSAFHLAKLYALVTSRQLGSSRNRCAGARLTMAKAVWAKGPGRRPCNATRKCACPHTRARALRPLAQGLCPPLSQHTAAAAQVAELPDAGRARRPKAPCRLRRGRRLPLFGSPNPRVRNSRNSRNRRRLGRGFGPGLPLARIDRDAQGPKRRESHEHNHPDPAIAYGAEAAQLFPVFPELGTPADCDVDLVRRGALFGVPRRAVVPGLTLHTGSANAAGAKQGFARRAARTSRSTTACGSSGRRSGQLTP